MPRPPSRRRRSSLQDLSTAPAPKSVTCREATVRSVSCQQPSAMSRTPSSEMVLSVPMPCCMSLWGPSHRWRRHLQALSTLQASSPSGAKRERARARTPGRSGATRRASWEPTARLRSFGSLCRRTRKAWSLTSPTSLQESGKSRSCSSLGNADDSEHTASSSTPWQPWMVRPARQPHNLPRCPSLAVEPHKASAIAKRRSGAA
mmetsp:Transcript_44103/g.127549  ORF Transcript_44103/g.127549 Transcript_44103/m.127549 type:complete len:204 (+) Transcript_44103:349-960(+)